MTSVSEMFVGFFPPSWLASLALCVSWNAKVFIINCFLANILKQIA